MSAPHTCRHPEHGGYAHCRRSLPAVLVALLAFLGKPLHRRHLLAIAGREHDDALRRAAGDADAVDRAADQLAAVGDQHDLVGLLDRERGDDAAVLFGDRHGDDAFAAAAGGAVLVGRGALAEAFFGNRQHELLGFGHDDIALLAELDGALGFFVVGRAVVLGLAVAAAPHRVGALEIGNALVGAG